MSKAAARPLRALLSRALVEKIGFCLPNTGQPIGNRLLSSASGTKCVSGFSGRTADKTYEAMTGSLTDAEFAIPRQLVADIAVYGAPTRERDGSISFGLEALTIEE